MSDKTAEYAFASIVATSDDTQIAWETFALLEALGFDYERFCRILDVDPDAPETQRAFEDALDQYAFVWNTLGQTAFDRMLLDLREKWAGILVSEPKIRIRRR
jgi:hypothetical protein